MDGRLPATLPALPFAAPPSPHVHLRLDEILGHACLGVLQNLSLPFAAFAFLASFAFWLPLFTLP